MAWLIGILKFIFSFIGIASTVLFVLACMTSIVNPQIKVTEEGKTEEKGTNTRYMLGLIMSIAWALVIALP